MTVNPDSAAGSFEYQGQTYYFCSTHCLDKFREDPEKFLNKLSEPKASQPVGIRHESKPTKTPVEQTYTCPMHPEVRQDKPGSCPKCGMALEPLNVTLPKQKIEYTCPMHPQIARDAPGNCPIRGMALEPRTVSLTEEENPELVDGHQMALGNQALVDDLQIDAGALASKAESLRADGQTVMFVIVDGKIAGLIGVAIRLRKLPSKRLSSFTRKAFALLW
jgi:YHS domain-containing protein